MAITLEGFDPTLFNFWSGLLSLAGKSILLFVLTLSYGIIIKRYLSAKGRQLPASSLGNIPPNFFSAVIKVYLMNLTLSLPMIVLVAIFASADFSDSIARLGIAFVPTLQEGDPETVLVLAYEKRNPSRLLETAGDPVVWNTAPKSIFAPPGGFVMVVDGRENAEDIDLDVKSAEMKTWAHSRSFMSAVENVAIGQSPLSDYPLSNSSNLQYNWQPWGGFETSYWTHSGGGKLSSIPLAIPLNCSSQEMALYRQQQGVEFTEEELSDMQFLGIDPNFVVHDALVPNCTFLGVRQSGIYDAAAGKEVVKVASIVEEALLWVWPEQAYTTNSQPTYALIKNGVETASFPLTPKDKTLAKDRENWTEGRTVEGVDGIRYGDLIIEFNHTVIASGPLLYMALKANASFADLQELNDPGNYVQLHNYLLVATPKRCPLPPSGAYSSNDGLQCLAYILLECPRFNEDVELWQNLFLQESSQCTLSATYIVWGQNFVADSELAAVVAGLYGIIHPSFFDDPFLFTAFVRNSILGALVAMATVETMPSNRIEIVPQIDVIFFIFMALPLILAAALLLLYLCNAGKGKDVPTTSYHMLILGRKEHANIPLWKDTNFPTNVNNRLVFKQNVLKDHPSTAVLTTAADQDRFLVDCLLRIAVCDTLKRMKDDEQRKEWISNRISHANNGLLPTPGMSCCSYIAQTITKPGMSWSSYITQVLNDRLEFLDRSERVAWLRKAVEKQYSGMMDQIGSVTSAPDKPNSDVIQDLSGNMTSAPEQSDLIQALDDTMTSASDEHNFGAVEETITGSKKRKKISDVHGTCVACSIRTKNGCPGCNQLVCKKHWEDGFNHAICDAA